jgi:hypothetical protein
MVGPLYFCYNARFSSRKETTVLASIAAEILVVIAVGVAAFQACLALGAPWGEWAFGGQHVGVLPRRYRASSALSLIVYALQATLYAQFAGWIGEGLPAAALTWLSWVFVAFFALGTLMNALSRSKRERALWTPIVAFSLLCAFIVAL